jgi:hypothetical protein
MAFAAECTAGPLHGISHVLRVRNHIGFGTIRTKGLRILRDTVHGLKIADLLEPGLPIEFLQARCKSRIHGEGWRNHSDCCKQNKGEVFHARTIAKRAGAPEELNFLKSKAFQKLSMPGQELDKSAQFPLTLLAISYRSFVLVYLLYTPVSIE